MKKIILLLLLSLIVLTGCDTLENWRAYKAACEQDVACVAKAEGIATTVGSVTKTAVSFAPITGVPATAPIAGKVAEKISGFLALVFLGAALVKKNKAKTTVGATDTVTLP